METYLGWLQIVEHELLLFSAFWFIVGAIDEAVVDLGWLYMRMRGKARTRAIPVGMADKPLAGKAAILVPAWHEADVIEAMIRHTLKSWQQSDYRLYVGCYRNDAATLAAAMAGAARDPRVRLVVHDADGPTTKADCLNRLYLAMGMDEARTGRDYATIVMHDAEDMVHPAALPLIDQALGAAEFIQLPVRPEPQPASPWIAGHYSDEFTESHAKSLVFRDAIGAAIPAAGVGCGFSRDLFRKLAELRRAQGESGPFAAECLTEDYELGLIVSHLGGRGRFVRALDEQDNLVATRSYFPADLESAVRQKTRWTHGIALQSWDRMGWTGRLVDIWMATRDRRGPLAAFVLAAAYVLIPVELVLGIARANGWYSPMAVSSLEQAMLAVCLVSVIWRILFRFGFTTHEYGLAEGFRAVLRVPVANLIAILAARRALFAYARSLAGEKVVWDKTSHAIHPATVLARGTAQ